MTSWTKNLIDALRQRAITNAEEWSAPGRPSPEELHSLLLFTASDAVEMARADSAGFYNALLTAYREDREAMLDDFVVVQNPGQDTEAIVHEGSKRGCRGFMGELDDGVRDRFDIMRRRLDGSLTTEF